MVDLVVEAYREFEKWDIEYLRENHKLIGTLRKIIENFDDESVRDMAGYLIHVTETENIDLMGDLEYVRRTACEIEELHGRGSGDIEPGDASPA